MYQLVERDRDAAMTVTGRVSVEARTETCSMFVVSFKHDSKISTSGGTIIPNLQRKTCYASGVISKSHSHAIEALNCAFHSW
jgi:hypothetical protein